MGNYNLLYQTLIALMTYFNVNCIYYYKALSILFDYLLAFYSAASICQIKRTYKNGFLFGFNAIASISFLYLLLYFTCIRPIT